MKPKKTEHKPQRELFRVELSLLVDANHALVKLGRQSKGVRPRNVKSLELNEIHTSSYCLTGRAH